tara:strand:- start:150 stop:437 length:288 start_codon:yes stop_codon:yes gene_type:complete
MCGCNNKENVVNLPHINIYTAMAEYKAKIKGAATRFGEVRVNWDTATQEELAWVYEEANNGSHYVEKINKKSSNEESTAKVSKKSSNNKKESKEE